MFQIPKEVKTIGTCSKELDYAVVASGSSGNFVRIGPLAIDCGIPYAQMKDELYRCHTLLITHMHSDHLKESTLKSIIANFPRIRIYANATTAYKYYCNEVIGTEPFERNGIKITPFPAVHDIECTGFIIQMDDLDIIYTTDTAEINLPENLKDMKFDYCFIESNYDEVKLRQIAKQYSTKGYDASESMYRHLSTQKAKSFYYSHRKSPDSKFIELHKSKRFY